MEELILKSGSSYLLLDKILSIDALMILKLLLEVWDMCCQKVALVLDHNRYNPTVNY